MTSYPIRLYISNALGISREQCSSVRITQSSIELSAEKHLIRMVTFIIYLTQSSYFHAIYCYSFYFRRIKKHDSIDAVSHIIRLSIKEKPRESTRLVSTSFMAVENVVSALIYS